MKTSLKRLPPDHSMKIFGLFGAALVACSSAGGAPPSPGVHAGAAVHGSRLLSLGTFKSANGTYTGCQNRTGLWSVGPTPDHTALTVLQGDTGCTLKINELHFDSTFSTASPITVASSYGSSSAFKLEADGAALAFYGNVRNEGPAFTADFQIDILVSSDTASLDGGAVGSSFAVETGSVSAGSVAAPNYTIDLSGLILETDVSNVVTAASGSAVLGAGSVTGQGDAVVLANLGGATYDAVDAAYLAANADGGAPGSIGVSEFQLMSTTLPQVRTVIIAHTVSGVSSYETFVVTFNHP